MTKYKYVSILIKFFIKDSSQYKVCKRQNNQYMYRFCSIQKSNVLFILATGKIEIKNNITLSAQVLLIIITSFVTIISRR